MATASTAPQKKLLPDLSKLPPEEVEEFLQSFTDEDLREMAQTLNALEKSLDNVKPKNDDELWWWVKRELNVEISRVSVCKDHVAPFKILADIYFQRTTAALIIGSRGGGKTFVVAIIHYLLSLTYNGYNGATFAGSEQQCFRCYDHIKNWVYDDEGNKRSYLIDSKMRRTIFKNGSAIEIAGSTPECHPPDERILTLNGYKPISELDPEHDCLASYRKAHNYMTWGSLVGRRGSKKIAFPFQLGERKYHGSILNISTSKGDTLVTPNHRMRIKLADEFQTSWVIYLMCKNDWWRIGKTTGRALVRRLNEEKADALWILASYKNEKDAIEAEAIYQSWYGITGVCFAPYKHTNARINDPREIHQALADDGESTDRSRDLLADFNMTVDKPFCSRKNGLAGRILIGGQTWFDVNAGNLLPISDLFMLPAVYSDFEAGGYSECKPLEMRAHVEEADYDGMVYSLNIDPHHYYVAGGHVVHNSVNGPHPNLSHGDEVELMRQDTFDESRNMAISSSDNKTGEIILAQEVLTSTRKSRHGRVQQLVQKIKQAIKDDVQPPFDLYIFCIWEIAAPVSNCQVALNKDPQVDSDCCECHRFINGEWGDGSPRTLKDVCGGKLHRSRGHLPFSDVAQKFMQNSPRVWVAQQECRDADVTHNYVPSFSTEKHGVRMFQPVPENGPIFMGIDWGTANPAAVNWYQLLNYPVESLDFYSERVMLKEGTLVCFDEIYKVGLGASKLADLVVTREARWRQQFPNFTVRERWADPQGRGAREDWKDHDPPLLTRKPPNRNFDDQIEAIENRFDADLFRVDVGRCEVFCREIEDWHRDPQTGKQVDVYNHTMSDFRYCNIGVKSWLRKRNRSGRPEINNAEPGSNRGFQKPLIVNTNGKDKELPEWRKRMGAPVQHLGEPF